MTTKDGTTRAGVLTILSPLRRRGLGPVAAMGNPATGSTRTPGATAIRVIGAGTPTRHEEAMA
ncbi:hypothetical protein [Nonomuraea sp. NPDC052265]|uniref:hypothetical protein n=1 Tax=Nonomuraea sp. NPDC052265 TaxID=3364374 RepID=UPI0037C88644